ncbi:hypothetical protein [Aliikangiella sp. G2MR2-5]|nr:hypothetical protein [Aliikangiella sp. G2MR2-5]
MNRQELFDRVQRLSQEYYYREISYDDYRRCRKELLKEIDQKMNRKR